MVFAGASLMAGHLLTLPEPASRDLLAAAIAHSRTERESGRWLAIHVLYADCGCSQRVLDRLEDRSVATDATERLVLVGGTPDAAYDADMTARGYTVERLSPKQLGERYGVESAPMLIVSDPVDELRYVGGYTDRKRGPDIKDRDILEALGAGADVEELPLFGCAVSRELQGLVDPMGLKYRKEP